MDFKHLLWGGGRRAKRDGHRKMEITEETAEKPRDIYTAQTRAASPRVLSSEVREDTGGSQVW